MSARHAQTVTYKRDIKLPPRSLSKLPAVHLPLNDSGLGATDLDTQVRETQVEVTWKQRFLIFSNRINAMHEKGDGTAYFGIDRQSAQMTTGSIAERHVNTSDKHPEFQVGVFRPNPRKVSISRSFSF